MICDMDSCAACVDAATCVDAVLPARIRQEIRDLTGLWPVGIIAGRVCEDDHAKYVPFSRASGEHLAAVLVDNGAEQDVAERLVAASWWALHLCATRDPVQHAVLQLAREAYAYRVGFLMGQLQPWTPAPC